VVAAKNGRRFITSDESVRAVNTARSRLAVTTSVFSLEHDSALEVDPPRGAKKARAYSDGNSVRLETTLDVDFWEVDPAWDGILFKSAAQAQRHVRSGELPFELKIKIGRGNNARVRLVTVQGREFFLDVEPVTDAANRFE
jgi:hypothetical protein